MTTKDKTLEANETTQAVTNPTASAATETLVTEATTTATAVDSRADERARIAGITTCAEASDKSKLANHLAFNTDLSVESAKAILESASKEVTQMANLAVSPLDAAMVATGNPEIGADATGDSKMTRSQEIIAAQKLATGEK